MVDYVSSEDEEGEVELVESDKPIDARELVEAARKKRFKSAFPEKEDDLVHDIGALTCFDVHPVNSEEFRADREGFLKTLARDNTQLLFNKLFAQPALKTTEGVFAELPPIQTPLPREKPIPKPKPMTKWEEFAKIKGIVKHKRSAKVWNEERDEYVPRFGRHSAKNESNADWLVELGDVGGGALKKGEKRTLKRLRDQADRVVATSKKSGAQELDDAIGQNKRDKKKRVEKQRKQEERNRSKAREKGLKAIPGSASAALLVGQRQTKLTRSELKGVIGTQLKVTRQGTASAGKFAKTYEGEAKARRGPQQRSDNWDTKQEGEKQHRVLDRVLAKEAKESLDIRKAVDKHLAGQKSKEKEGGGRKRGRK